VVSKGGENTVPDSDNVVWVWAIGVWEEEADTRSNEDVLVVVVDRVGMADLSWERKVYQFLMLSLKRNHSKVAGSRTLSHELSSSCLESERTTYMHFCYHRYLQVFRITIQGLKFWFLSVQYSAATWF